MNQEIYQILYKKVKGDLKKNGQISTANILLIVIALMKTVENHKELVGFEKKQLILHVLNEVAKEIDDLETRQNTQILITMLVPDLIDSLISVDKGEITFSTKKCQGLLSCCTVSKK